MPFYEYECSACGAQVEVLQKITDAPLKKCTGCGKNQLKKLVSAPVFRLKGGGWYETDFKSEQDKKRNLVDNDRDAAPKEDKPAEKAEPAAEKPAASAEPKKESKPASTSVSPKAKPAGKAAKPASMTAKKKPVSKPTRAKSKR